MYWKTKYGEILGNTTPPINIIEDNIVFNWFSLNNNNIITSSFNPDELMDFEYNTFNIPREDWKGLLSRYFREKTLNLKWVLIAGTPDDLTDLIDNFKKNIYKIEGIFKYKAKWIFREIKATCIDITIKRENYNLTFVNFDITFKSNEPFFYDSQNQSLLFENVSILPRTEWIINEWSSEVKPIIYNIFKDWTNLTDFNAKSNNIWITYSWIIVWWDILEINGQTKEVKLNSILVDYSWTFPELQAWYNTVIFSWTGIINAEISVIYKKTYL